MIRWALRRAIDKFERTWNYDASYMRDMIEASPRAAWLFSPAAALGQFRRDLPIDAWCAVERCRPEPRCLLTVTRSPGPTGIGLDFPARY